MTSLQPSVCGQCGQTWRVSVVDEPSPPIFAQCPAIAVNGAWVSSCRGVASGVRLAQTTRARHG